MENHLKVLLFLLSFSICTYSQVNDSISTRNISPPKHSINIHSGTIPVQLAGKLGIGYRYRKIYLEADYFGRNTIFYFASLFPYMYLANSYSKASITTNYLFTSKRKPDKHFILGLTMLQVWDNNSPSTNEDGLIGFHVYPSIGYFNEKPGKSIFGLGIKLGALSYIRETQNPKSDIVIAPLIDLTISVRLFQSK